MITLKQRNSEIREVQKKLTEIYSLIGKRASNIEKELPNNPYTLTHENIYNAGMKDGFEIALKMLEPFVKNFW